MSTKEQLLEEIENVENNQMIENDYTELQKNLWPDETVDLLVCEGGDVGRSALWKEEITPCYIQNAINRFRPIHNCSTKYLYYWLFLLKHSGQ